MAMALPAVNVPVPPEAPVKAVAVFPVYVTVPVIPEIVKVPEFGKPAVEVTLIVDCGMTRPPDAAPTVVDTRPGRFVNVCPLVVGNPVPAVPMRNVVVLAE